MSQKCSLQSEWRFPTAVTLGLFAFADTLSVSHTFKTTVPALQNTLLVRRYEYLDLSIHTFCTYYFFTRYILHYTVDTQHPRCGTSMSVFVLNFCTANTYIDSNAIAMRTLPSILTQRRINTSHVHSSACPRNMCRYTKQPGTLL